MWNIIRAENGGRRNYLPCVRRLNLCGGDYQLWDLSPLVSNLFSGSLQSSHSFQVSFQLCRCDAHWWLRGQRGCPLLLSKVFKHKSHTDWNSTNSTIFCIFPQLQWARKESQEGKKAAAVAAANQPGCFCCCWKISKAAVLFITATAKSGFLAKISNLYHSSIPHKITGSKLKMSRRSPEKEAVRKNINMGISTSSKVVCCFLP